MRLQYKDSLVTFVDLLGFRELVDQSDNDPQRIADVLSVVKEELSRTIKAVPVEGTSGPREKFQARNFSDLIVRCTVPSASSDFHDLVDRELFYLAEKQLSLVSQKRVLLRGGVSFGKLFMDEDFVFGRGLVKSYILESKYAIYPRIVVDRKIFNEAALQGHCFEDRLSRGEDGVYFIDYLFSEFLTTFVFGEDGYAWSFLDEHRESVEAMIGENIERKDERIKQKLMWLALYHNRTIERLVERFQGRDAEIRGLRRRFISSDRLHF